MPYSPFPFFTSSTSTTQNFLGYISIIYAIAFISAFIQWPGLCGRDGLLPVELWLSRGSGGAAGAAFTLVNEKVGENDDQDESTIDWWYLLRQYGLVAFHRHPSRFFPSFLRLDADTFMDLIILTGASLALLCAHHQLFRRGGGGRRGDPSFGLALPFGLTLCWMLYHSVYRAGQRFFSFQWECLLQETGGVAILLALAPPGMRRAPTYILRFILFKLLFMSGILKLQSRGSSWTDLSALSFHFASQPLPTPLAWFAHNQPPRLAKMGVAVMFIVQIPVALLILSPFRLHQRMSAVGQILLQILILLTGNYNYFNVLTLALCVVLWGDEEEKEEEKKEEEEKEEEEKEEEEEEEDEPRTTKTRNKLRKRIGMKKTKLIISRGAGAKLSIKTVLLILSTLVFLLGSIVFMFEGGPMETKANPRLPYWDTSLRIRLSPQEIDTAVLRLVPVVVLLTLTMTTVMVTRDVMTGLQSLISSPSPSLSSSSSSSSSSFSSYARRRRPSSPPSSSFSSFALCRGLLASALSLSLITATVIPLVSLQPSRSITAAVLSPTTSGPALSMVDILIDGDSMWMGEDEPGGKEIERDRGDLSILLPPPISTLLRGHGYLFSTRIKNKSGSSYGVGGSNQGVWLVLRLRVGLGHPRVLALYQSLSQWSLVSSYGLFRQMTGEGRNGVVERPELVVEGRRRKEEEEDGERWSPWKEFRFAHKPGERKRRPSLVAPHQPRLDWQMWFAALSPSYMHNPWCVHLVYKLLEGSPDVYRLLDQSHTCATVNDEEVVDEEKVQARQPQRQPQVTEKRDLEGGSDDFDRVRETTEGSETIAEELWHCGYRPTEIRIRRFHVDFTRVETLPWQQRRREEGRDGYPVSASQAEEDGGEEGGWWRRKGSTNEENGGGELFLPPVSLSHTPLLSYLSSHAWIPSSRSLAGIAGNNSAVPSGTSTAGPFDSYATSHISEKFRSWRQAPFCTGERDPEIYGVEKSHERQRNMKEEEEGKRTRPYYGSRTTCQVVRSVREMGHFLERWPLGRMAYVGDTVAVVLVVFLVTGMMHGVVLLLEEGATIMRQ